ncbi:MAG: S41 family peptidase [Henriciella sp.]
MNTVPLKLLSASALLLGAAALTACGGGGGGGSSTPTTLSPPPPPPPASGPSWTAGVFEAASTFKDQCLAPRSGVNIEGDPFTDQQGTLEEELFWLRSWTEETYLWNDEVTDQDPTNFSTPISYFGVLKTNAVTASGEDKDDFHFSQSTEDFLEQRNSAPTSGYGVSLAFFSNAIPRDVRVRYTEPGSPASTPVLGQVPLPRGSRILAVDGVDLVNDGSQSGVDTLNAGLFPEFAGETHSFTVRDVDGTERTFNLTSQNIAQAPVNRFSVINTPTGDVGYILFNTFSPRASEEAIVNAISSLEAQGVTDLVLDLRYNGGGLLAVASQLAYMIAGDAQTGAKTSNPKTFEQLQFNADAGNTNPVEGGFNAPIPFYDETLGFENLVAGAALDSLNLPRVFILSTGNTCSASEAVINGLRGIDVEIILIGNITCGKPYGFYPTDNCGETYYTIQFRGVNDKGFGDYSDGFVPMNSTFTFGERVAGCIVADDYTKELGDETEGLLAAALDYRSTGACPAVVPKTVPVAAVSSSSKASLGQSGLSLPENLHETNRDMRMPY